MVILNAVVAKYKRIVETPKPPESLIREPYDVFRNSATPAGLYARQKWLGESSTARWKADFVATVADLYRWQSADGLWRGSPIETIHRLFGLHLTVRNPYPRIDNALDALLKIVSAAQAHGWTDRPERGYAAAVPTHFAAPKDRCPDCSRQLPDSEQRRTNSRRSLRKKWLFKPTSILCWH